MKPAPHPLRGQAGEKRIPTEVAAFVKKVRARAMQIANEMQKRHGGFWTSTAHLDEAMEDVLAKMKKGTP